MKRFLPIIILLLAALCSGAQVVNVSKPQSFLTWIQTKDSILLLNDPLLTDSSSKVISSGWIKRQHFGGGSGLTFPFSTNRYLNGYGTFSILNSDSITEGSTNLFWTAARSRAAMSVNPASFLAWNTTTGQLNLDSFTVHSLAYLNTIFGQLSTVNGKVNIGDTNSMLSNYIKGIVLNTPSVIYGSPINFSISSGIASGSLTLLTQTQNKVFAAPTSSTGTPTFRLLTASDIPTLDSTNIPTLHSSLYYQGINDGRYVLQSGFYPNPSWIPSLAWSKLTGTPTTILGYNISDAVSLLANNTYSGTQTYNASGIGSGYSYLLSMINTTAATSSQDQNSAAVLMQTHSWTGSASGTVSMRQYMGGSFATGGVAYPFYYLDLQTSDGTWRNAMRLDVTGGTPRVNFPGTVVGNNIQSFGYMQAGNFYIYTSGVLNATATLGTHFENQTASTAANPTQYGFYNDNWGSAWNTSTSTSQIVKFKNELRTTSGSTIGGRYYFSFSLNNAVYSDVAFLTDKGEFTIDKLNLNTGSNKTAGTATLVGGTVTVSDTRVTSSSLIYLTVATPGGTQGTLSYSTTAGTSFTINSTSSTETSVVNYLIIN